MDEDGDGSESEDSAGDEQAPKLSRKDRREEKRRVHDAQKKAKAIDKANDKRTKGQGMKDKKANKNKKKTDKKAEKGKRK